MSETPLEGLLLEIEDFCRKTNVSKRELARTLGIPYNTFRTWFHKGKRKREPSVANTERIKAFMQQQEKSATQLRNTWSRLLEWWDTQHRYVTVKHLADEIGWDAKELARCIHDEEMPSRLVLQKIAETVGFEAPPSDALLREASRRTEKVKNLLLFLEEELRWFRDGSREGRDHLRQALDPDDVGYISSLLTMLGDEDRFSRWLALTSNRFRFFRRRRGKP